MRSSAPFVSRLINATLALCLGCFITCGRQDNPEGVPRKLPVLKLVINEENTGLVYRYYHVDSGKFRTVSKISSIPKDARKLVAVYDMKSPVGALAADEMIMTDLTAKGADGTYPFRIVKTLKAEEGLNKPSAQPVGGLKAAGPDGASAGVLIFATAGCPHCSTAREYFKAKKIPFKWIDLERDPKGRQLLQKLGAEQKLPPQYLNSVPIIYVKGKLVIGFAKAEIEQLLGK